MKTSRLYRYIILRRAGWNVEVLCRILGVSESGYYRSIKIKDKPKRRELLLVKIKEIINRHEDNDNYGAQRVHLALTQAKESVSYSTVYRIMKVNGLLKKPKRYPNGITREDAAAQKSENLIQRIYTSNPGGWLLAVYRERIIGLTALGFKPWKKRFPTFRTTLAAADESPADTITKSFWVFSDCTFLDNSIFTNPGKPTQNGYIESFNGKLWYECLNQYWFRNLSETKYNRYTVYFQNNTKYIICNMFRISLIYYIKKQQRDLSHVLWP